MQCSVCGARVDATTPLSWRCPNSTQQDYRHVMRFEVPLRPFRPIASPRTFTAFREFLAVDRLGEGLGIEPADRARLIEQADDAVARVAGTGFRVTPLSRADELSDVLGFNDLGGIWIKDETANVAGSHKARHLFTILLHLLMVEHANRAPWTTATRPPLAIASCGNAAIAASTLAKSQQWPIRVFVPVDASDSVMATLHSLGATVVECPRLTTDPPGDPCIHRFREAVADGAIPFTVQGTENAWCLDGGRTIGWEITRDDAGGLGTALDRIFVQVGGGAFASSIGASFRNVGTHPRLHAVQTAGCAPLARAWTRALETGGAHDVGARWAECMWPWEHVPRSLADGILDDETYDWIGVIDAMTNTGGSPVVAAEELVVKAHEMAHEHTDINVSPTGSAGLAGVLAIRHEIASDERIVVIFSGVQR